MYSIQHYRGDFLREKYPAGCGPGATQPVPVALALIMRLTLRRIRCIIHVEKRGEQTERHCEKEMIMRTRHTIEMALLAGILAVSLAGCGGKPKSEVEALVDEAVVVDRGNGQVNGKAVAKLAEYGEEAIAELMKRIEKTPEHLQYCYSDILIGIRSEPARFKACKELLKHPNSALRTHAVEGMVRPGSPDEAIELAIKMALEAEKASVRSSAIYALSHYKGKKFRDKIMRTFRRATNDPEQMVREHANRGILRMQGKLKD